MTDFQKEQEILAKNRREQQMEFIDQQVLDKYETVAKIGKGAYGMVWSGIDKQTREPIAIKKIYDAFDNATDS